MKKIVTALLCISIITGCTNQTQSDKKTIPVTFKPTTMTTALLTPFHSKSVNKTLKEIELLDASIILYTKKDDEEPNIS